MPPSGYSAPVHLVTPDNVEELISHEDKGIYDPKNGYREAYSRIWKLTMKLHQIKHHPTTHYFESSIVAYCESRCYHGDSIVSLR